MKQIRLGKYIIELYDSIDELPVLNYQKFNKCLLLDSGIGSDIDTITNHIIKIASLINTDKKSDAIVELENMQQNLLFISNNILPKYISFCALIKSIDGKQLIDLSDTNLHKVLNTINAPVGFMDKIISIIKKKLDSELELYFVDFEVSPNDKGVYDKLKQRTLLILDGVKNENNNSEEIETIDNYLFGLYKPSSFYGRDSAEIKFDKYFENCCFLINQKLSINARELNVLSFFNSIENIKKQIEAEAKAYKK
jgi:hypothetical protein